MHLLRQEELCRGTAPHPTMRQLQATLGSVRGDSHRAILGVSFLVLAKANLLVSKTCDNAATESWRPHSPNLDCAEQHCKL